MIPQPTKYCILNYLLCVPGCNRVSFFKKQLIALARATQNNGYNALLDACKQTQLLIDQSYPSIPAIDINQQQPDLQTISFDKYSKSILPDEWKHMCPITCYGDGNCLYRYVVVMVHVLVKKALYGVWLYTWNHE